MSNHKQKESNMQSRLDELLEEFACKFKAMRYSDTVLEKYRRIFTELQGYASENHIENYSIDMGRSFLEDRYGVSCDVYSPVSGLKNKRRLAVRSIYVLDNLYLHGQIVLRWKRDFKRTSLSSRYESLLNEYAAYCRVRYNSKNATDNRIYRLRIFLGFMESKGVMGLDGLTSAAVLSYVETLFNYSNVSVCGTMSILRCFLSYCRDEKSLPLEPEKLVPRIRREYSPRLPKIWSVQEMRSVLGVIDRGNPLGLRNYALILLAFTSGLRICDIRNLHFSNIDWTGSRIRLVQQKTGEPLELPLLKETGWAILDYIRYGRPKVDSPFVFLSSHAPFPSMAEDRVSFARMLRQYAQMAGVKFSRGQRTGFHSLRHHLATRLLEADVAVPLIAQILGHVSEDSCRDYTHLSIEDLRQCALDPDDVHYSLEGVECNG